MLKLWHCTVLPSTAQHRLCQQPSGCNSVLDHLPLLAGFHTLAMNPVEDVALCMPEQQLSWHAPRLKATLLAGELNHTVAVHVLPACRPGTNAAQYRCAL
jgi:hypothetical protein